MNDVETAIYRRGVAVYPTPGSRTRIAVSRGDWFIDEAIYNTFSDDDFEQLVHAYETDDHQAVKEHIAVARERVPGLVALAAASDTVRRDRAVEHAINAYSGMAGAHVSAESYAAELISVAELLGDYIKNGA